MFVFVSCPPSICYLTAKFRLFPREDGHPLPSSCTETCPRRHSPVRDLPCIYGGVSPALTSSAGVLCSQLEKPRVEGFAGVKQFANGFSVFVFIFNSLHTHGSLPQRIGKDEMAQREKNIVAE